MSYFLTVLGTLAILVWSLLYFFFNFFENIHILLAITIILFFASIIQEKNL